MNENPSLHFYCQTTENLISVLFRRDEEGLAIADFYMENDPQPLMSIPRDVLIIAVEQGQYDQIN